MSAYDLAKEVQGITVKTKRTIHENQELGFDITQTTSLAKEKLTEDGLNPNDWGKNGVTALIGSGDKTFLVRADMYAFPAARKNSYRL